MADWPDGKDYPRVESEWMFSFFTGMFAGALTLAGLEFGYFWITGAL